MKHLVRFLCNLIESFSVSFLLAKNLRRPVSFVVLLVATTVHKNIIMAVCFLKRCNVEAILLELWIWKASDAGWL